MAQSKQTKEVLHFDKAIVGSSDEDRRRIVKRPAKGKGPQGRSAFGRSAFLRCGGAVLAVGLALVLQMLLIPWFGGDSGSTPFIMFFGAVVVAAWFGGLRPGLLATALSALASDYFFLFPQYTLQISSLEQGLRLGVFILEGVFISTLVGMMHSARQRAEESMLQARKDERGLRESEERFRTLSDTAPVMIWESGTNALCYFFNRPWLEFRGRSIEQEMGNGWLEDGVHPADYDHCLKTYQGAFEAREEFEMEYRLRRCDGEYRWILDKGVPRFTPTGDFIGYIGSCIDITERKRDEEELRATHKDLADMKFAIDESAIIAFTDQTGKITYVNDKFLEISKYSEEELLGQDHRIINSGYHPKGYIRNLWRTIAQRSVWHGELRNRAKDGSYYWVDTTIVPFLNEWGKPYQYVAIRRDVTARHKAEEGLAKRASQQATVAELGVRALAEDDLQAVMKEAVTLVARTLEVEYCEVLELLSEGEELLLRAGVGWKDGLIGKATVGADLDSQAGYTLLSKEPVITKDLSAESRFNASPLLDEHGVISGMSTIIQGREAPFGVLGTFTTSRRTFTHEDVNFLQAVANVVATAVERKQAEEKLGEVREAERQRIARDLHDEALQDLTYALAEAQLVEKLSENPQLSRRLERLAGGLKRAGQGLRGAIYDLHLEERDREQSFVELLESLVELERQRFPDTEIVLSIEEGFTSSLFETTEAELLRILREALINARRHSAARGIRVAVGASGGKLCAEVKDDGRGFDPAKVAAGMGTKGMQERARALGGDLRIESKPNEGTRVRFELALQRDGKEPEEQARILLVEDHASFREGVAAVLEQQPGFSVVGQAGSLAEAREVLSSGRVDMAIVDLGLPDGYGGELMKELREANPQAQALVLSASLDRSEIARAVESGAAGVLHKSVSLDEIAEAVRRLKEGETILPVEEVVELLRLAGTRREQGYEASRAIAQLTPREKEILQTLAEGFSSQQIAERLHISIQTERNHVTSILTKLGVHSRLEALVFALRYDVVEIS